MRTTFYADLAERVFWTFVQAFIAVWAVMGFDMTLDVLKAAAIAAAISVAKGLLATQIGDNTTASTLPSPGRHSAP